jgi:hypothetical protein
MSSLLTKEKFMQSLKKNVEVYETPIGNESEEEVVEVAERSQTTRRKTANRIAGETKKDEPKAKINNEVEVQPITPRVYSFPIVSGNTQFF